MRDAPVGSSGRDTCRGLCRALRADECRSRRRLRRGGRRLELLEQSDEFDPLGVVRGGRQRLDRS
jgi:hypothetical protein